MTIFYLPYPLVMLSLWKFIFIYMNHHAFHELRNALKGGQRDVIHGRSLRPIFKTVITCLYNPTNDVLIDDAMKLHYHGHQPKESSSEL